MILRLPQMYAEHGRRRGGTLDGQTGSMRNAEGNIPFPSWAKTKVDSSEWVMTAPERDTH
jgi:hypothetical protein